EGREADDGTHAERLRRMGERAAVGTGRGRGDAAPARIITKRKECVGGAAQLEAAGLLPAVELEEDGRAQPPRQARRMHQRRRRYPSGKRTPRALDRGEADRRSVDGWRVD